MRLKKFICWLRGQTDTFIKLFHFFLEVQFPFVLTIVIYINTLIKLKKYIFEKDEKIYNKLRNSKNNNLFKFNHKLNEIIILNKIVKNYETHNSKIR